MSSRTSKRKLRQLYQGLITSTDTTITNLERAKTEQAARLMVFASSERHLIELFSLAMAVMVIDREQPRLSPAEIDSCSQLAEIATGDLPMWQEFLDAVDSEPLRAILKELGERATSQENYGTTMHHLNELYTVWWRGEADSQQVALDDIRRGREFLITLREATELHPDWQPRLETALSTTLEAEAQRHAVIVARRARELARQAGTAGIPTLDQTEAFTLLVELLDLEDELVTSEISTCVWNDLQLIHNPTATRSDFREVPTDLFGLIRYGRSAIDHDDVTAAKILLLTIANEPELAGDFSDSLRAQLERLLTKE